MLHVIVEACSPGGHEPRSDDIKFKAGIARRWVACCSASMRHIPLIPGWSWRIFKYGSTRPVSTTRHHYYANIQPLQYRHGRLLTGTFVSFTALDLFAYDGIPFCAGLALGSSTAEAMWCWARQRRLVSEAEFMRFGCCRCRTGEIALRVVVPSDSLPRFDLRSIFSHAVH